MQPSHPQPLLNPCIRPRSTSTSHSPVKTLRLYAKRQCCDISRVSSSFNPCHAYFLFDRTLTALSFLFGCRIWQLTSWPAANWECRPNVISQNTRCFLSWCSLQTPMHRCFVLLFWYSKHGSPGWCFFTALLPSYFQLPCWALDALGKCVGLWSCIVNACQVDSPGCTSKIILQTKELLPFFKPEPFRPFSWLMNYYRRRCWVFAIRCMFSHVKCT